MKRTLISRFRYLVALWLAGAFLAETDNYLGWERSRPVVVEGSVRP